MSISAHLTTKEEIVKLQRCGACGEFQNVTAEYLKTCSKEEIDKAELVHCGCEFQEEIRYVTRDMALDAGDLSLEGQQL